ncbi:MAG: CoA ester lyase [Gammaproteobacteria bacterium]|nr:CoA ester lyase [Gammaproteobacteria bacterium]
MTRLRRSVHFVPGGNERMLVKALATNADSLIFDLEDAVTPDRKDEVRGMVASWLADTDFGTKEKTVRMNPLDTQWGHSDLEATMVSPPDAYVVPKPETLEGLNAMDAELSRLERLHGHPDRGVGLILIAETPLGALNSPTFPGCPRVEAMTWGGEDMSAVLGVPGNRDADGNYLSVYQHTRVVTLLSAAAGGVQPLDAVYVDFRDIDGLREECEEGARLGFIGKLSIHPNQIDVINEAFTPAPELVAEARALIEAFDEAQVRGRMAFSFNGQMVDMPHLSRARALLERARLIEENAS